MRALEWEARGASGERVLLYRVGKMGLGHVFRALLQAAAWARAEGWALAIDATSFQYFAGDAHRQFFDCFALEAPADLRVIVEPEDLAPLMAEPEQFHVAGPLDLAKAGGVEARVVVVHGTMPVVRYRLADRATPPILRIGLRGWLRKRVIAGLGELLAGGPTIGIYFRHGNGEHLIGRFDTSSFPDHAARLAALQLRYAEQARHIASTQGWLAPRYFIASDNADFVAAMRKLLPDCIALARNLPDRNYMEHIKASDCDQEILYEAVQDLWGLSACSALIYSESAFARFAIANSGSISLDLAHNINAPKLQDTLPGLPAREAVALAEAAYRATPSGHNALLLADAYQRAGDSAAEAKVRQRAVWSRACRGDARIKAARTELDQGRPAAALERLAEIHASSATDPYSLLFIAQVLLRNGRNEEAVVALRRAVALDDGIREVNLALSKAIP